MTNGCTGSAGALAASCFSSASTSASASAASALFGRRQHAPKQKPKPFSLCAPIELDSDSDHVVSDVEPTLTARPAGAARSALQQCASPLDVWNWYDTEHEPEPELLDADAAPTLSAAPRMQNAAALAAASATAPASASSGSTGERLPLPPLPMWTAADLGIYTSSSSSSSSRARKPAAQSTWNARPKSALSDVSSRVSKPKAEAPPKALLPERKRRAQKKDAASGKGGRKRSYSELSAASADGAADSDEDAGLERDEHCAPVPLEESLLLVDSTDSDSGSESGPEEPASGLDGRTRVPTLGQKHKQSVAASRSQPPSEADEDSLGAAAGASSAPTSPSKKAAKKRLKVAGGPKQASTKAPKPKVSNEVFRVLSIHQQYSTAVYAVQCIRIRTCAEKKKAVPKRELVEAEMRAAITSDAEFYTRVLNYEPIDMDEFLARVQATGQRVGLQRLVNFLDAQALLTHTA